MDHFFEKIDGWSSMGDQGNLIKNILNHVNGDKINIAEIGVYKGRATAIFNVELINRNIDYNYYAIDHFLGSEEHDNTVDYYSIALENLNPIIDKINLIKNDSINESEKYPDNYFDIVYIDASHDYESVKKDIIAWLPKVKDGGIICGDDYVGGWPGVVKAVNEVIGEVQVIGHQQWFKIKKNNQIKVALVCIAKNEDNYIEEWINYNTKLGFDDIFIYENDWKCNIERDNLHKIQFDGKNAQISAYNDFLKKYKNDYDWVAFFDVDEFLVLKKHNDIKSFIQSYSNYNAIGINWVLFGDNNLQFDGDYSVLSRFTKRQIGVNEHIKSIVKMKENIFQHVHHPDHTEIVSPNYNLFDGPFNPNGNDEIAQLNHYFCKTWDEWNDKKSRGRADLPVEHESQIRPDSDFHRHNFNEIVDTSALDFYSS